MFFPPFALSMPGGPEWLFIFFLCLLLFGAKRLPELARGLGKSVGEFQKAKDEIEREIAKASAPVEIRPSADIVSHTPEAVHPLPATTQPDTRPV